MKKPFLISCAAAAVLATASHACADWQYTKWGMTAEQFAQASNGAATLVPYDPWQARDGKECIIKGTYQSEEQEFQLTGCFGRKSLNLVVLTVSGKVSRRDVAELVSSLSAKYGTPSAIQQNYKWTDLKNGNRIELHDFAAIEQVEIFYMPIRTGNGL